MERDRDHPVRLIEDGIVDEEKDLVAEPAEDDAEDVPPTDETGDLSPEDVPAEEAAIHVEERAPGATDGPDSYLEDQPEDS
jgi:hypothetical protein